MSAKADFHNHSTASDGKLRPAELVALAAANGVRVFAMTDHDSTEGIVEAMAEAKKHPDLFLVPGVELSTDIEGTEVHVLGYLTEDALHNEELQAELTRFRAGRFQRGKEMVEKLTAMGMPIRWERVLEIAGDASVGRPHVAQALLEAGYVSEFKEAFDRFIGRNGPAYVEREKMEPAEAVATLKRFGAPPVLAHPSYVKNVEAILPGLIEAGLTGMEVYYRDYDERLQHELATIAKRFQIMPLGGSDYHGLGNPGEREPGNIPLPSRVAKDFLEKELPWVPTGALT